MCTFFQSYPNTVISKFIHAYQLASSHLIKKGFTNLRKFLLEREFLAAVFGLLITGRVIAEII